MANSAIAGVSLQDYLQRTKLSSEEANSLARQIGEALAQSHAAGHVNGNLTLWSIVLRIDPSGWRVTIGGSSIQGTTPPAFEDLAPECREGGKPTVAADIYSFGRILQQIRNAMASGSTASLPWEAAIHRCLDPAPERRFASVSAVLRALGLTEATASFDTSTTPTDHDPKMWGGFQLLQRLGVGSFGEVYRAWDPVLEREVALKLLLPRGLDPEGEYAAIVAEARAMARVRHPNIVSVHGVDRRDGRVGFLFSAPRHAPAR